MAMYKTTSFASQRVAESILPSLYDASYALAADINQALKAAGHVISLDQYVFLSGIKAGNGTSQMALANWLGRDRSIVSRLLTILEKNGWVVRQVDAADKRKRGLKLTAHAERQLPALEQIVFTTIESRCRHIDPQHLAICINVLIQIYCRSRPDQKLYAETTPEES
jgi:DNA-binding MarR family transcriptional regulator